MAANFIALAEGSRPWMDVLSGQVRTDPFYDGLIWHRVVAGFVIQTGSRAGDGSGGAGYTFIDQFHPSLDHSATGTLSMANTGYGSNGSQIFITLAPQPDLDDHHSVFGEVISGLDVVLAIGAVPVGINDKPLTNVVIHQATILRCGIDAEAFDVDAYGLPDVVPVEAGLVRNGSDLELVLSRNQFSDYYLYQSPDFSTWSGERIGLYFEPPPTGNVNITGTTLLSDMRVYTVPGADYPPPLNTPPGNASAVFVFTVPGAGATTNVYDAVGAGTYSSDFLGSGIILSSTWLRDPYRGRHYINYLSPTYDWDASLVYHTPTSGVFNATVFASPKRFKTNGSFSSSQL